MTNPRILRFGPKPLFSEPPRPIWIWGSEFKAPSPGFRVCGFGFGIFGLQALGFGCRFGLRNQGVGLCSFGFRVGGLGF